MTTNIKVLAVALRTPHIGTWRSWPWESLDRRGVDGGSLGFMTASRGSLGPGPASLAPSTLFLTSSFSFSLSFS